MAALLDDDWNKERESPSELLQVSLKASSRNAACSLLPVSLFYFIFNYIQNTYITFIENSTLFELKSYFCDTTRVDNKFRKFFTNNLTKIKGKI